MSEILTPQAGGRSTDQMRYAVAPIRDVDFRDASANHDGSWTISGYAAVFDQETVLYDGTYTQVRESIAPDAFNGVLASRGLVHLNLGHDMNRSVASTDVPAGQIGSLELSADSHGLRFMARVDRNDPDAQALAAKMSRGVIRQASFAFNIERESSQATEGPDGREILSYRIEKVRALYDVCCTPQGAYAQTETTLRSLGASFGQPASREADRVKTPETDEGANVVTSGVVGTENAENSRRLALLRLKARQHFPETKEPQ